MAELRESQLETLRQIGDEMYVQSIHDFHDLRVAGLVKVERNVRMIVPSLTDKGRAATSEKGER
jgi:hypothetical protein